MVLFITSTLTHLFVKVWKHWFSLIQQRHAALPPGEVESGGGEEVRHRKCGMQGVWEAGGPDLPDVGGGEALVLPGQEELSVAKLVLLFVCELGLCWALLLLFQLLCETKGNRHSWKASRIQDQILQLSPRLWGHRRSQSRAASDESESDNRLDLWLNQLINPHVLRQYFSVLGQVFNLENDRISLFVLSSLEPPPSPLPPETSDSYSAQDQISTSSSYKPRSSISNERPAPARQQGVAELLNDHFNHTAGVSLKEDEGLRPRVVISYQSSMEVVGCSF